MSDFDSIQKKLNALLKELRSWDVDEARYTMTELAKKFDLEVFVVDRIVQSEGVQIKHEDASHELDDSLADPNASTLDLDPDEVQEALTKPDPNPDFEEDADTGIWKKKPTGEWVLVNAEIKDEDES